MTNTSTAIACTLSGPETQTRIEAYRRDLSPFLTETTYTKDTSQLAFSKAGVSREMLEHVIELEQECCSFLNFELSESATHFHLSVSGPEGSEDLVRNFYNEIKGPKCGCSSSVQTEQSGKVKTTKYMAGFITLCAIGCAIPPTLAAVGLIGVATGAYIGNGIEAVLIATAVAGLGFVLFQYWKKKRRGLSS